MFIFYDTETSSRDLLGQILSYAFWVVDDAYVVTEKLEGLIRLSRIQLPEIEAILVNQINLDTLQATGDPEWIAAQKIFDFLNRHTLHQNATLVGFNSNQFDLQFLRNLFIRYGINPYFYGRLKNLDVLHFAKWVADQHPDTFLWQMVVSESGDRYPSFKLEALATAYGLLDAPQAHEASADVALTLELVKTLEARYGEDLRQFSPIQIYFPEEASPFAEIAKQSTPQGPVYWAPFLSHKKEKVFLNLSVYADREPHAPITTCLKYINPNKHFFVLQPLTATESVLWEQVLETAAADSELLAISSISTYFELIRKSWDIEYQIHELGFERIDQLHHVVSRLIKDPHIYEKELNRLVDQWKASQKSPKDTYLLQLYNRAYLNIHPNPPAQALSKYLFPRYIAQTMLRNPDSSLPFFDRLSLLKKQSDLDPENLVLRGLLNYYLTFEKDLTYEP